jgi:hypothetical protein
MKKILTAILLSALLGTSFAQHQELNEKPGLWKNAEKEKVDTHSILYAFKKGQVHGHFRYFFMATDNASGLTDYYANAAGGGIKYETAPFKKIQLGVSGFFAFNIGSSNLAIPDPKTSQFNRYEIGLFDIEDASNKTDIDRLEELYIKYNLHQSKIIFGKQLINTPFINLQDGRMRPTEVEGIWADINEVKNTKIETGWLYGISPRSTVKWYKAGESIGLYPQGVNTDGTKAGYKDNLESKGIGILGITHTLPTGWKWQVWEQFTENIFNTLLLQADYTKKLKGKTTFYAGAQAIRQQAIKNGGNENVALTYFTPKSNSQTFGARAGFKNEKWDISFNYNRITAAGRYLVPREWGREPFFTFLPRERNEGLGNVHAYVIKTSRSIPKARIKIQMGAGFYNLPEVTDYKLNKYGLPSYAQLNIDMRYEFTGLLKGLGAQLLYVYKDRMGNMYNNEKYVINKVDMSLWNMVINYHF